MYALVIRPIANPTPGTYALTRSGFMTLGADVYARGTRLSGGDKRHRLVDSADRRRHHRRRLPNLHGHRLRRVRRSGLCPHRQQPRSGVHAELADALVERDDVPANTTLRFQVAGSNSAAGPFAFVGPDGTAATFFTTSGASLGQFDGKRYLKYRAYLSTTDSTVTPTLNDVTVCYTSAPPDLVITKSDVGASVAPGGTVGYFLTYVNAGGQGATGVVLSETVPANTTFNPGASTAGWVCLPNNSAGSTCALAVGTLATGSGATAVFAATVLNPVAAGVTQIANTASIADDGTHGVDPTPGNNTGSDTTPVIAAPDLSITKSDGGASVAPGGTVVYALTYGNAGNRGASGVVLTETVPVHTTFNAGASTVGWVCSPNDSAGSTCTLAVGGVIAGGGNQTATFAVTVDTPLPSGVAQIANTASIADDGANGVDPTPGNNTGSDTTPVTGAPDLSITKSDGGASVAPGGTVAYTLTYANTGNRGASGVVLTETVPVHTTFNAGASTAGWVCSPNDTAGSTCTLAVGGLVAGGGSQTATFAVTVDTPLPGGVTQIANTASIADDGANGVDPTPGNNTGSDTTPVIAVPDLSITKSDGGVSVAPGGTVAYVLTYANSGSIGATGVVITETVPTHATFQPGGSTAGWSCTPDDTAGSTCLLTVGSLAGASGSQTATFAVAVDNPLPGSVTEIDNTASIADDGAGGPDPTPVNNSGSVVTPVQFGLYYALTPCRLFDTRNPAGPYGGPALAALSTRTFVAAGQCGVPAGVSTLVFNITVTLGTAAGDLRVYGAGAPPPLTSVINYGAGRTRANNGVVALGAAGDFVVQSDQPTGTVHVIIDVMGYFR